MKDDFGSDLPEFSTRRFDVYRHDVVRSEKNGGLSRSLYHAWFHSEDVPRPVCEVTVNHSCLDFVEWIHVAEAYRREGIATEVMRGIEEEFGLLEFSGVTESGELFCEFYERETFKREDDDE